MIKRNAKLDLPVQIATVFIKQGNHMYLHTALVRSLRTLAAGIFCMVLAGQPAIAQTAGMRTYSLNGFSLSAPADWTVTIKAKGSELNGKAPDGNQILMAWWWFPDEPLLGYPDIVSHKKIKVAGQPALYIRTFTGSRESLSLTFDRSRKDRRRLHLLFDVGRRLTPADIALFDRILASLKLGN